MANFATNNFYQIYLSTAHPGLSMVGTGLYDEGKGAAFFGTTNTSNAQQQWQIFPYNSSYYVLRTLQTGAGAYLEAAINPNETTQGNTVPDTRNVTLSDDSMFWTINPWGDGSFFFTNAANGSDWHLQVKPNGLMAMSSNITAPQPGQQFLFSKLGTIDKTGFSSVMTPSATASATSSGTATRSGAQHTGTGGPNGGDASTNSGGLSTGAKAAIGASVGVVALLALFVLIFFFMKRRKARAAPKEEYIPIQSMSPVDKKDKHEAYGDQKTQNPSEMPAYTQPPVEMQGHSPHQQAELTGETPPVELPADAR